MQSAERRTQSAERRTLSAERRVQSAERRVQNAERRTNPEFGGDSERQKNIVGEGLPLPSHNFCNFYLLNFTTFCSGRGDPAPTLCNTSLKPFCNYSSSKYINLINDYHQFGKYFIIFMTIVTKGLIFITSGGIFTPAFGNNAQNKYILFGGNNK